MNTRICKTCGVEKREIEFTPHSTVNDQVKYRSYCRDCYNARANEWYHRNRDRLMTERRRKRAEEPGWVERERANKRAWNQRNKRQKKHYDLRRYGITIDDYERMFEEQNRCCAICGGDRGHRQYLDVDHCHDTGQVRGLLCSPCNIMLGKADHDPKSCEKLPTIS